MKDRWAVILVNIAGEGPSHVDTPKLVAPTRTCLFSAVLTTSGPPLSPWHVDSTARGPLKVQIMRSVIWKGEYSMQRSCGRMYISASLKTSEVNGRGFKILVTSV